MEQDFQALVDRIPAIALEWHRETIIRNSLANVPFIWNSINEIQATKAPCLIVSAGPSLYREGMLARIVKAGQKGILIAADGAYIQCLKAGIRPDYVITLDPHPTRMVRWFGDHELKENMNGDDYFSRQDLDVGFRRNHLSTNSENISLVDGNRVPLIICSTAPQNVVKRTAAFKRYWFAPLVDDPETEGSITRNICEATDLPAMNTGGTVGTAAWVFAHSILKSPDIAGVGMDLGYYYDTPLEQTQSWHMLKGDRRYYPSFVNPQGKRFFTDPTYASYKQNFLDLLEANDATVTNCSGAGLLYGDRVKCVELETWLRS